MAFGGALVEAVMGPAAGPMGLNLTGITLLANIGAFAIAAGDSGAFTTDNTTTPANHTAINANFGPGEGNWVQAGVDAVIVTKSHSDVNADSRFDLVSKVLTAGNLVVNFHSTEAGIVTGITVQLVCMHSMIRGR